MAVARAYYASLRAAFPDREIILVTGGTTSFKQRRLLIDRLERSKNGILVSTQQSLSASTNIDFVDKVIITELHYNNAAMSQYYFRFIRYTSTHHKHVFFLTYRKSIESNLLKMILAKEKLNLFMKDEHIGDNELYERFGDRKSVV